MQNFSFRIKLTLSFFAMAVLTTALFGFFSIRHSQKAVFEQIRSKVLSVASSAAVQIDGDLHETLTEPDSESSPAYLQLEKILRTVRDANRREDIDVVYVYTMRQISTNPNRWIYVADAEEWPEKSPLGKEVIWDNQGAIDEVDPMRLGEAYADHEFTIDEYGNWLCANAPIRNSAGEIIGMLGVDIRADDVTDQINHVFVTSLFGLGVALVLAALLSFIFTKLIYKPLEEVVNSLRRIGKGHLEMRVPDGRADEFGEIYGAVNEMAQSLQDRDTLKGNFSRFVSQEVASRLISEGSFPKLDGKRGELTLLSCDIKNLNQLAENRSPAKILEIVNNYCEEMVEVVLRHQGTIDRLLGDSLVAVYGAINCHDGHQLQAVRSAAEILEVNERINKKWGLTRAEAFKVNIAVHTGLATFGNIGSDHRVDFRVLGEAIDILQAIEALNEEYKTNILVSESTQDAVSSEFRFVEVGDYQPAPLRDMIRLFTIRKTA